MKTIGLIGGMSWESTASYYSALNEGVKAALVCTRRKSLSTASILPRLNICNIRGRMRRRPFWRKRRSPSRPGALISSRSAPIPCTRWPTVSPLRSPFPRCILPMPPRTLRQITRVGLLGTRFTMEQAFYKDRMTEKYGLEVLVPDQEARRVVHDIIYNELCLGEIRESSRAAYLSIINDLHKQGAEAVILGRTEIALPVQQQHTDVPLYDTTLIHAQEAVDWRWVNKRLLSFLSGGNGPRFFHPRTATVSCRFLRIWLMITVIIAVPVGHATGTAKSGRLTSAWPLNERHGRKKPSSSRVSARITDRFAGRLSNLPIPP